MTKIRHGGNSSAGGGGSSTVGKYYSEMERLLQEEAHEGVTVRKYSGQRNVLCCITVTLDAENPLQSIRVVSMLQ